jgi:hypothetical protein
MIERVCPRCQRGNPLDHRFCGDCGTALQRFEPGGELAPRSTALTIAGRQLPITLQQVGRTVALGALALAAEAAVGWLRRRGPAAAGDLARILERPTGRNASIVTIVSQRVIETVERGARGRTVSERSVWRKIEE